MNKFIDIQTIEQFFVDPLLNQLLQTDNTMDENTKNASRNGSDNDCGVAINDTEISLFMKISQNEGELFIAKYSLPKLLSIINEKIGTNSIESWFRQQFIYFIWFICQSDITYPLLKQLAPLILNLKDRILSEQKNIAFGGMSGSRNISGSNGTSNNGSSNSYVLVVKYQ